MSEGDKLTSQLLEIFKQLANSSKSFKLTLETKDINFSFSSKDRDLPPKDFERIKKKSPSQKNRDFQRRKLFLEKRLDQSNSTINPSEKINVDNTVISETQDILFKCEECDYTTTSKQGLRLQHETIEQIYGIDDTGLKIIWWRTDR